MTNPSPVCAHIVGAGPAGLMAAERLALAGVAVTVIDQMPSVGRKLLMAGRGGLNLTHDEPMPTFLDRYGPARDRLAPALATFPPDALRAWCEALGQPVFVGTSARVFPVALKASPLLRAWLARLQAQGVVFALRHRWTGWDGDGVATSDPPLAAVADATVLAMGGASWPRLGSDGAWVAGLQRAGVGVAPLLPANCGFRVQWSDVFRERFEGAPLKRVAATFGGRTVRGEATLTAGGIEGGVIYALSSALRDAVAAQGHTVLRLDLRPDLSVDEVARRVALPRRAQSLSTFLRKAVGLPPVAIALLRETAAPAEPASLAAHIKSTPLRLTGVTGLARAISTAGGVRLDEVDERWMLRARPGVFVAGEMLDWEAPTGGYLLQAAFSTGYAAGEAAAAWLKRARPQADAGWGRASCCPPAG